jgi:hypothetical protein
MAKVRWPSDEEESLMTRLNVSRVWLIAVAALLVSSFVTVAETVVPDKNIFAEKGLIHILGPSPAISPSADKSAVDSWMLESCDVLKDLDTYYWYYHARSKDQERWPRGYRICVATAATPLGPWKKCEKNPILDQGPEGSWDHESVDGAVVLKEGAYDIKPGTEVYYMWYSASGPTGRHIGLATATNPLGPWKKFEGNPVVKDFGYLGGVVRKDGKFYMFVQHPVGQGTDQGPLKMAIADRPEGPWTKYEGNPVMSPGDWGAWDDGGYSEARVRYHEGIFHCFYGGTKNPKLESVGYAYSFDGINWHKYGANPVVSLNRVPDAAGFAEVHSYIEGSYIYLYHTLRFYTGEGAARGLSSYPPLNVKGSADQPATSHFLSHGYNVYDTEWRTEDLGIQVLTTDSLYKVAFPILMVDSLGPRQGSRLQNCLPIGLEAASTLAITTECVYDSDAKAGLRLHVRASDDGVHFDTVDLYTLDTDFQAGKTVRKTMELRPTVKYAKVVVENLDAARAVNAVKVTATVGN